MPCVAGAPGGDPAAVAFDAIEAALARGADTVLVDTAGRLHTQEGLMDELRKVVRVVGRRLPGAPHETLLVLDGTVGQNAVQQGRLFAEAVPPTGLVVTKLDGTARGGAVVALRRELGLPIRFIGARRRAGGSQPFDADAYVDISSAEAEMILLARRPRVSAHRAALRLDTPVKFLKGSASAAPTPSRGSAS